jgi:hypothetical protein
LPLARVIGADLEMGDPRDRDREGKMKTPFLIFRVPAFRINHLNAKSKTRFHFDFRIRPVGDARTGTPSVFHASRVTWASI